MVCVNLHNCANIGKTIRFDTSKNFSTVYYSMLDKSYDTFIASEDKLKKSASPLIDAIKKAVPIVKEPRVILAENMHNMILDVTKSLTEAAGKDAMVFPIPNHPDLVLRVEKNVLGKIDKLPQDIELVPIKYNETISQNKHLGLPLYFATSKNSNMARKNSISPMEALAQPDKIMVLRKVTGKHPVTECGDRFIDMVGFSDFKNPDPDALNNFSYVFGYIKDNFGPLAAGKCIDMFRKGVDIIPANALGEGSAPFEVVKGKEFCELYDKFAQSYIKSLKETSELPQKAYDDAVKFISSEKNFNVDFQHTNNTFIDLDKKEFNFMDFAYDKSDSKYIYENPVKEFRNVLYGKGFRRLDKLSDVVLYLPKYNYPRDFIVTPEYISGVKEFSRVINDKINLSAPEKLKSEKVFK